MQGLIIRATVFNLAAPGADTNILTDSLTPTVGAAFRLTISLAVQSIVNVTITDGLTTITSPINDGNAVEANRLKTFEVDVNPFETNSGNDRALSYNFQVAIDGIIEYFVVAEAQLGGV